MSPPGITQHDPISELDGAADFRTSAREAAYAIDAALLAADILGQHGIIESGSFDQLVNMLHEAASAIAAIDVRPPSPPTTIFPTRAIAEAFIEHHPLSNEFIYVITEDGAMRCAIGIFRLVGHL
jgi:hypothetical protein